MGKGISKADVTRMMLSVINVGIDLYPYDYSTDCMFVDMIMPIVNEHDVVQEKDMIYFELSYNTLLRCIDDKYGVNEYLEKFRNKYDVSKGIGTCYNDLIADYSSPEILVLYGMFPNLVYMSLTIHLERDSRPQRDSQVITLNLPDIKIKTMSIKLRDLLSQDSVDTINKYIITNTNFDNNVMSKRNTFMTDKVSDFFGVIEALCQNVGDDDFVKELYSAFSFLDIDELKDVALVITTDWPVL